MKCPRHSVMELRTCVDINNNLSFLQICPLLESGQKEATSEKGHVKHNLRDSRKRYCGLMRLKLSNLVESQTKYSPTSRSHHCYDQAE